MEHTDAIRMNAVERYLLGEMDDDERKIFEEHFFDCMHCVAAINAGTQLMVAGRRVALEDKRVAEAKAAEKPVDNVIPFWKRYRWVPQAAAAGLLLTVGAQIPRVAQMAGGAQVQTVAPALDALHAYREVEVDLGVLRGEKEKPLKVQPGTAFTVNVADDPDADHYKAEIRARDLGGKVHGTELISREAAANPVSLVFGELPAGIYVLVIEGVRKDGTPLTVTGKVIEVGER